MKSMQNDAEAAASSTPTTTVGSSEGDDMEKMDPIAKHLEEWRRDDAIARDVLYAIRLGAKIEITHDSVSGWEMSGQGLGVFIPFDSGAKTANMILAHLVSNYRQLCALLGNPDNHGNVRQALKANKRMF
ncbi:hypothetical protein [Lutibaculum baratangense]|uniref:hypothetical protein n=1 Tax=Lutibaculum baratangense TaxID=1358440 RepID=UPI0005906E3D|nr:hypothetical protein [Lutibaculum baratangense]